MMTVTQQSRSQYLTCKRLSSLRSLSRRMVSALLSVTCLCCPCTMHWTLSFMMWYSTVTSSSSRCLMLLNLRSGPSACFSSYFQLSRSSSYSDDKTWGSSFSGSFLPSSSGHRSGSFFIDGVGLYTLVSLRDVDFDTLLTDDSLLSQLFSTSQSVCR